MADCFFPAVTSIRGHRKTQALSRRGGEPIPLFLLVAIGRMSCLALPVVNRVYTLQSFGALHQGCDTSDNSRLSNGLLRIRSCLDSPLSPCPFYGFGRSCFPRPSIGLSGFSTPAIFAPSRIDLSRHNSDSSHGFRGAEPRAASIAAFSSLLTSKSIFGISCPANL